MITPEMIILFVRYLCLAFLGIYFVFSLVMLRQTFLLTNVLVTKLSPLVKILGLANVVLAILFFLIALGVR